MSARWIAMGLAVGFSVFDRPVWGQLVGAGEPQSGEGKIAPEVYAALEKSADRTVLVEVTLPPIEGHPRFGETWDLMSRRQDAVLAKLEPGEFEVLYRPVFTAPIMVGRAGADALPRLASDPDVVAVKSGKITSDVYSELDKSDDGRAFVCIVLREPAGARIKEVQDKVLAKLKPEEFKPVWRFETAAMMTGQLSAAGLAKLATLPQVLYIRPSKVELETYRKLEQSDEGMVYVSMNLKRVPGERLLPREERKSKVAQIQDRVLSVFEPGEFQLIGRASALPFMDGHINAAGLAKLEAHPDVIGVGGTIKPRIRLNLLESVPFIKADLVHYGLGYTGAGITVAVLDSGIDASNPDVQGDVAPGAYHFLGRVGGGIGPGAVDGHGHGTTNAAIITSPNGVAPDAEILPIKVLDDNNRGHEYDWVDGIDHVVRHQNDYPNLCVINMSSHNQNIRPF